MDNLSIRERIADIVLPLLVMSIYLSMHGKGFLSYWPVMASLCYAIAQPFVRFFVLDRVRKPLVEAGQANLFLLATAILYSSLAMVIVELVL